MFSRIQCSSLNQQVKSYLLCFNIVCICLFAIAYACNLLLKLQCYCNTSQYKNSNQHIIACIKVVISNIFKILQCLQTNTILQTICSSFALQSAIVLYFAREHFIQLSATNEIALQLKNISRCFIGQIVFRYIICCLNSQLCFSAFGCLL